ncbi:MAG: GFA family protein, partial [Chthoniobacterales bacterium]
MAHTHTGSCYCGAVVMEMKGDPLDMGYCHCAQCRRYSGAPVNAFLLWKEQDVKITKGEELLSQFQSSEISD